MDWNKVLCAIFMFISTLQDFVNSYSLRNYRKVLSDEDPPTIGVQALPKHLPEAESINPGYTLPTFAMLQETALNPYTPQQGLRARRRLKHINRRQGIFGNSRKALLLNALNHVLRRHIERPMIDTPKEPDDLPAAEPIAPGDTLIRPKGDSLQSSAKYPHKDSGGELVYGNIDNLSITHGKTPYRLMYSSFRKNNVFMKLLSEMLKAKRSRKYNKDVRRRSRRHSKERSIGTSEEPEDSSESEQILPRETLMKPDVNIIKFPLQYTGKDVVYYGSLNNIEPIAAKHGSKVTKVKKNARKYYNITGPINFNVIKDLMAAAIPPKPSLILLKLKPKRKPTDHQDGPEHVYHKKKRLENELREFLIRDLAVGDELENYGGEFSEESDSIDDNQHENLRRHVQKSNYRHRNKFYARENKEKLYNCTCESSASGSDSDNKNFEKNPGNPYTVFKDKYRVNWLWNFNMGDHINVNPNAPRFPSSGPSGAELFFGRKWWYFNQDDFVPFR